MVVVVNAFRDMITSYFVITESEACWTYFESNDKSLLASIGKLIWFKQ